MQNTNFSFKLAFGVHEFIDGLTSKYSESVRILDDSTIESPRSKKVELLAKVHNNTTDRFLKGFKLRWNPRIASLHVFSGKASLLITHSSLLRAD